MLRVVATSQGSDLGVPVARYLLGGVSDVEWRVSLLECMRARRQVLAPRGLGALKEWVYGTGAVASQFARRSPRRIAGRVRGVGRKMPT